MNLKFQGLRGLVVTVALGLCSLVRADGFIDDAKASLVLRNFYMSRDFVDNGASKALPGSTGHGQAAEWTQSFILDAKSGFTGGAVGFGLDALGMLAIKLDGGRGTYGTQLLPTHDGNRPADDFGRLAVAGKARFSSTELKVGEWMPVLPILRADDGRSLPQTLEGAQITSREIPDVTLYGGQFRGNSQRNDASMQKLSQNSVGTTLHGNNSIESDAFNFVGGDYTFNRHRTVIAAWYGQLEDLYRQQYFQLVHTQPLGEHFTLGANIGYFIGTEDGAERAGSEDNRTLSGLFSLKTGGNTFYIGLQRLNGDTGLQRVAGTSGATLANDSYGSSYDLAKERSWQVRHDYNFAALGVPGLTLMNRFIKGSHVHTGSINDGEERGRETEVGYTFQDGALKFLNLRWRNAVQRRSFGNTNSFNENRLIIQYPFSIL